MEQAPASLASKEEGFRGTHLSSFCPSLSFKPDTFADRWTAWLKHFRDYIWCPRSINHTLLQPTVANSTPSFLPAHDLLLCQLLGGPQGTDSRLWQVFSTPFEAFQGGDSAEVIPVGLAWAPCSSQALLQLGAVAHVQVWPQKDRVRAASSELVSFHQCLI